MSEPKFKIGQRVRFIHAPFTKGTIEQVNLNSLKLVVYLVKLDGWTKGLDELVIDESDLEVI